MQLSKTCSYLPERNNSFSHSNVIGRKLIPSKDIVNTQKYSDKPVTILKHKNKQRSQSNLKRRYSEKQVQLPPSHKQPVQTADKATMIKLNTRVSRKPKFHPKAKEHSSSNEQTPPKKSQSPSRDISPYVRRLIKHSLHKNSVQKAISIKKKAERTEKEIEKHKQLKEHNEKTRKKNSKNKKSLSYHKLPWGADQRILQEQFIEEKPSKKRGVRNRRDQIGLGLFKSLPHKHKKSKSPPEKEEKPRRHPDPHVVQYMQNKKRKEKRHAAKRAKDTAMIEKIRDRSLKNLSRPSKNKHVMDRVSLFRRNSPEPTNPQVESPGLPNWDMLLAQEVIRSDLVDQFRQKLKDTHETLDQRLINNGELVKYQLSFLKSKDSDYDSLSFHSSERGGFTQESLKSALSNMFESSAGLNPEIEEAEPELPEIIARLKRKLEVSKQNQLFLQKSIRNSDLGVADKPKEHSLSIQSESSVSISSEPTLPIGKNSHAHNTQHDYMLAQNKPLERKVPRKLQTASSKLIIDQDEDEDTLLTLLTKSQDFKKQELGFENVEETPLKLCEITENSIPSSIEDERNPIDEKGQNARVTRNESEIQKDSKRVSELLENKNEKDKRNKSSKSEDKVDIEETKTIGRNREKDLKINTKNISSKLFNFNEEFHSSDESPTPEKKSPTRQISEGYPLVLKDSNTEELDKLIKTEIENYIDLISFSKYDSEVNPDFEMIDNIIDALLLVLLEDEDEILDVINTPIFIEPLEKLHALRMNSSAKIVNFDLILLPSHLDDLKSSFNPKDLKSKSVYLQMIFDCINESLNYIRPYGVKGFPMPWSQETIQIVGESSICKVFDKVLSHMAAWHSIKVGALHNLPSDREALQDLKEDRMSRMLCSEAVSSENMWVDYEDEEAQATLELSDLVLEFILTETIDLMESL